MRIRSLVWVGLAAVLFSGQSWAEPYRLAPGDRLLVTVWGLSETQNEVTVEPDGCIALHPLGRVDCQGLTAQEVQERLRQGLMQFYRSPVVTVAVTGYSNRWILCLGAFVTPGQKNHARPMRLLEALALAGGLAPSANQSRCVILRRDEVLIQADLRDLLQGKDPRLNLPIEPGDTIYVPATGDRRVFIMGEVRAPGVVALDEDVDVLRAIAAAGGTTEDATSEARLLREEAGHVQVIEVSLRQARRGRLPREALALQDGDVIHVPSKTITRFNYALEQIMPTLRAVILAGAAQDALTTLEVLSDDGESELKRSNISVVVP